MTRRVPARRRLTWRELAWLLAVGAVVSACASGGAVPRPFPGGPVPPTGEPAAAGAPAPPASGVLTTALTLRGIRYRNGGSDPSGFDCSGFVQYVFGQHGLRLPREVRDQFRNGQAIARGDIQPGDLVFFETVSRGASHVGIALGGDEFVHAPSSRGVVRVERYTNSYWARRYVGARRVAAGAE